jgi:hypothetical protein
MRTFAVTLLVVSVLGYAEPARANWLLDADAGLVYESNVGLAQEERDIKSDVALVTSLSGGWAFHLDGRNVLSLTADVSGAGYDRLPGLSNVAIGATTSFTSKLGLGPEAPRFRLWGSGARLEYDDDVRDGWRHRVGTGIGKRFGEHWDLRFDYTFEQRIADHGKVVSRLPGDAFDTRSHTYAFRGDYQLGEGIGLFAGYALRDGEVVSTTRRNGEIFAASKALTADPAFGRDFFAYKIDAAVHLLSAGLSVALGAHASVNVGYEHWIGQARGGLDYTNNVVRFGFLYSF